MLLGRRGGSVCDTMKCKGAHMEWAQKRAVWQHTRGSQRIKLNIPAYDKKGR